MKKIGKVNKIRKKKTSGCVNGQELVFLVLQTQFVAVPEQLHQASDTGSEN